MLNGDPSVTKEQYIEELTKALQFHSEDTPAGYRYVAPRLRPDGILSNEEVARIIAPFQKAQHDKDNLAKPKAANVLEAQIQQYLASIERNIPNVSQGLVDNLPGNWKLAAKKATTARILAGIKDAQDMYSGFFDTSNLSDAEKKIRENSWAARSLRSLSLQGKANKAAFAEVIDDRGNVIRIFNNPRSVGKAVGTDEDVRAVAKSLKMIRDAVGSDKKPVVISIVANSSFLPSQRDSDTDSNTLGFAFSGGGAHILPSRLKTNWDKSGASGPYGSNSWHSAEYTTYEGKVIHTVIHEIAHVMMYKYWGDDRKDNGATALRRDYTKFGLDGQFVSRYGQKNASEHFAEAYSRYILTGDATPEFMNLLRSKGLLKSQQNGQNG